MSINYFNPGKSRGTTPQLRKLLNYYYYDETTRNNCNYTCSSDKVYQLKQGYKDPSQTQNQRISQLMTSTLGGRTVFGNNGVPISITYLGGVQGQSGGTPRPLRNKF
jgi:hypothetical protein